MSYCPLYSCAVLVTINEHQWELKSAVIEIQLFRVIGHTRQLVRRRENGAIMAKAIYRQIHAKQPLVGIRWVVGR